MFSHLNEDFFKFLPPERYIFKKESAVDKRSRKQLYEPTTPLMNRQIQGDRSAEIIDKTSSSTEGPSSSKQRKLDVWSFSSIYLFVAYSFINLLILFN